MYVSVFVCVYEGSVYQEYLRTGCVCVCECVCIREVCIRSIHELVVYVCVCVGVNERSVYQEYPRTGCVCVCVWVCMSEVGISIHEHVLCVCM